MWNQKLLYKEENNHQREEAAYRRGNIPCQERGLESKIYKGLQNQTWRKQKQQQKWNQTIESLNLLAKWIRNSLKNYQWPTTSKKYSTFLVTREKQSDSISPHWEELASRQQEESKCWWDVEKEESFQPLEGVTQVATIDIGMVVPPKTENITTAWPNHATLGYVPKGLNQYTMEMPVNPGSHATLSPYPEDRTV